MSAGNWFWIIYVILVLFGGYLCWPSFNDRRWVGGYAILVVLIGVLGWGIFGPPIK